MFFSETHSPYYFHGHGVGDSFKHNSLPAAPVEPPRSTAHLSLAGGWGCSLWSWMCFTQRALRAALAHSLAGGLEVAAPAFVGQHNKFDGAKKKSYHIFS